MTLKERADKAKRYNKGIVAAVVTVISFASEEFFGLEIPIEVQGSLITIGVLVVPNRVL